MHYRFEILFLFFSFVGTSPSRLIQSLYIIYFDVIRNRSGLFIYIEVVTRTVNLSAIHNIIVDSGEARNLLLSRWNDSHYACSARVERIVDINQRELCFINRGFFLSSRHCSCFTIEGKWSKKGSRSFLDLGRG